MDRISKVEGVSRPSPLHVVRSVSNHGKRTRSRSRTNRFMSLPVPGSGLRLDVLHHLASDSCRGRLTPGALTSIGDGIPPRPHPRFRSSRSGRRTREGILPEATLEDVSSVVVVDNTGAFGEEEDEEKNAKSSSELYDFQRQWYPVGVVKDFEKRVEKREPIEVWLLGKRYVVWRKPKLGPEEKVNHWSVSIDVCPHRLAPLTEGRIEDDGDLMCSYHGWEFDCSGKCSSLPQAPQQLESKMTSEGRSCLSLLPVQEKYGLLWIWPEISAEGLEASKSVEPMSIPPCDAVESEAVDTVDIHWYCRDLPYDWDTFVENIVDPTHVPYAHHGIQGNRKKPGEFGMKLVRSKKDEGVRIDLCPKDPEKINIPEEQAKHEGSFIEFRPPFLIRYNFQNNSAFSGEKKEPSRRSANLVVMGVPTRPGYVRCLFKFVILHAEGLPKIAKWMIKRRPAWLDHMTRNKVFDSDGYLLYLQERELKYGSKKDWKQKFHMPTR